MVFAPQKNRITNYLLLSFILLFFSCRNDAPTPGLENIIGHANELLNTGDIEKSITYLDSAYNKQSKITDFDRWKKYQFKCNYFLYYEFNADKAAIYADSMLVVLKGKEKKYPNQYAEALFFRGDVLKSQRKFNSAFDQYFNARKFVQEHLDRCDVASYTNKLGLLKYSQQQYKSAIIYLKQALAESANCNASKSFEQRMILPQSLYNTIGLCHEKMGILDSAKQYYLKGLLLLEARGKNFPKDTAFISSAKGVFYGNLGGVYLKLGDGPNAEKYLKKSISINDRWGYARTDAQFSKLKLANYELKFGNKKELSVLIADLKKSLSELEGRNITNDALKLNWNKLMWDYYNVQKEDRLMEIYKQRYINLSDSLNKAEKVLRQVDMEQHFKETEQVYRLKLLDRDNHLKTLYIISILMFLFMATGILVTVWRNLRHSKKNVVQLTQLNNQIVNQNIEMQQTLNALEQSQKENTQLMGIVAHDLRNPLSSVILAVSLLKRDKNRSPDDLKMFEMMEISLNNSIELINDLLVVHSNTAALKKEAVELDTLLNYCTALLKPKAAEKGQEILLSAPAVTLNLSREKMWRVFSNLISNAVKFSDTGTTIKVDLYLLDDKIRITITDQGIGIPAEMKEKVFDMFTPAKRTGTSGEQPFGMGLSIAKQIVEAHGGKIWFESNQGKGTIFFVELPR